MPVGGVSNSVNQLGTGGLGTRPPKVCIGWDINCIVPQSCVKVTVTWDTGGIWPTIFNIRYTILQQFNVQDSHLDS